VKTLRNSHFFNAFTSLYNSNQTIVFLVNHNIIHTYVMIHQKNNCLIGVIQAGKSIKKVAASLNVSPDLIPIKPLGKK